MKWIVTVASVLCAGALKVPRNTTVATSALNEAVKLTQRDVDVLHKRLEIVMDGLESMVKSKMAASKIAPELKEFIKESKRVLDESSSIKDPVTATKKLNDVRAGMASLTLDLTIRQESLMKEEESQKVNLLLGVLMTHQKDPVDQQFYILRSGDFSDLAVSKQLLAKHDSKVPLYVQVAEYLDKQGGTGSQILAGVAAHHDADVAKADALAASFEQRVVSLQRSLDAAAKRHQEKMESLQKEAEKTPKSAKSIKAIVKREERKFKKLSAMQHHDIAAMQEAVKAIKNHDVKALKKVKKALAESIQGLQAKNSGFLVLIEMGHQFMGRDCPYCAAQCVGKCHDAGKPYTACLTECADAGK